MYSCLRWELFLEAIPLFEMRALLLYDMVNKLLSSKTSELYCCMRLDCCM